MSSHCLVKSSSSRKLVFLVTSVVKGKTSLSVIADHAKARFPCAIPKVDTSGTVP